MNTVNTNGILIRDAINLCISIIQILSSSSKEMQCKYEEAGRDWSDSKYQQLGDIVNECNSSLRKILHELDRCLISLNKIEQSIREYENINIFGSVLSQSSGLSSSTNRHMPKKNGSWSGEIGNSMWQPTNKNVLSDLRFYGNGTEGIVYRNGYADFSTVQIYECKLHCQLYYRNDVYQFVDCTLELQDYLNGHPELISYFDDEQLSAIGRGQARIPGYTWHHDIQTGRIQLVPTSIHNACSHEGGRSDWGGGTTNR